MSHSNAELQAGLDADGAPAPAVNPEVALAGMPSQHLTAWARALHAAVEAAPVSISDLLDRGVPRVLVLYQPPWEAYLEACLHHRFARGEEAEAWLQGWLRYHDGVLEARMAAPDSVFLVNASRLESRGERLLEVLREEGVEIPGGAPESDSTLASLVGEYSGLLARQLEQLSPEVWETYETLESAALLLGRDAEFRLTVADAPADELPRVLVLLGDALAARAHDAHAASMHATNHVDRIERLEVELSAARDSAVAAAADAQLLAELQLENELMSHMMQQLQEELAVHLEGNQELRKALELSTDTGERARAVISRLLAGQGQ